MSETMLELALIASMFMLAVVIMVALACYRRWSYRSDCEFIPRDNDSVVDPFFQGPMVAPPTKFGMHPESAIYGSYLIDATERDYPDCMVWIGGRTVEGEGAWRGYGVRIGEFLVTPLHVVAGQEEIILSSDPRKKEAKFLTVQRSSMTRFQDIEDLIAAKLTDQEWSKLGVKRAKIAPVDVPTPATVYVPHLGKMSMGIVSKSSMFGYLAYDSTTVRGCSGQPYMIGRQVAGIHLFGGNYNGGVASAFVEKLLYQPEETTEFIAKQIRKKGKLRYRNTPEPGIVMIEHAGKFHYIEWSYLANLNEGEAELVEADEDLIDYQSRGLRFEGLDDDEAKQLFQKALRAREVQYNDNASESNQGNGVGALRGPQYPVLQEGELKAIRERNKIPPPLFENSSKESPELEVMRLELAQLQDQQRQILRTHREIVNENEELKKRMAELKAQVPRPVEEIKQLSAALTATERTLAQSSVQRTAAGAEVSLVQQAVATMTHPGRTRRKDLTVQDIAKRIKAAYLTEEDVTRWLQASQPGGSPPNPINLE